jgi:MFS family permease
LIVTFGIIYAMCYGPEAALFSDLFDAKVRYTGISFVYQFSGIFASGITPLIATYLFEIGDKKPWSSARTWCSPRSSAWPARSPSGAAACRMLESCLGRTSATKKGSP